MTHLRINLKTISVNLGPDSVLGFVCTFWHILRPCECDSNPGYERCQTSVVVDKLSLFSMMGYVVAKAGRFSTECLSFCTRSLLIDGLEFA